MSTDRLNIFNSFIKLFKGFDFNIRKNNPVAPPANVDTILQSESHLKKMIQDAKRQLNSARKAHKSGKCSIEVLFDCEWRVEELEEELKSIRGLRNSDNE